MNYSTCAGHSTEFISFEAAATPRPGPFDSLRHDLQAMLAKLPLKPLWLVSLTRGMQRPGECDIRSYSSLPYPGKS